MRKNQKRKAKSERELCELRGRFVKERRNLERQITELKEQYKKDRREIKAKCRKIKQDKSDKQKIRDHLTENLPQRIEQERELWRQNFLKENNPSYREQEPEDERSAN